MTPEEKLELKRRIEEAVCPICVNYTLDGRCENSSFETCPINQYFDGLIEMIIQAGHMPWMDDYYEALRNKVCPICGRRRADGYCQPREDGDCAAYTYLPTIVKVVEDYLKEKNSQPIQSEKG